MSALPSYHALLEPKFSTENELSLIEVTLRLDDRRFKVGQPLLALFLKRGTTPTLRYDGDSLTASDHAGSLPLSYEDTEKANPQRFWKPCRDPNGQIIVRFTAIPRQTDANTPIGPRIDLRAGQGGAFGKGEGFLPYPLTDEDWNVQVEWRLPESALPGTHVASSLGDQLISSAVGQPKELIGNSIFAVGQLNRFPPWETRSSREHGQEFSLYWIGTLPYDANHIGQLTDNIFRAIAKFFGDTTKPFRVFIRRVWSGHGGTGAHRSFLLEYSRETQEQLNEESLLNLLAHETVHEYPLMIPESIDDAWYCEGVANYYAAIASFESGLVDRQYLIKSLNNNAQAYYTTNVLNLSWKYITDNYWDTFEMTKAGYGRGFMYLAQVQGLIHEATGGDKGVDDVVLALYERQLRGVEHHSDDFHELVGKLIGEEQTQKIRAAMEGGELIVPPEGCFAKYGLKLVRRDAERFEAGFHPNSLRGDRRIRGLVPGSRAEAAGVLEGDAVTRSWMLWSAGDALEDMMQVTVLRDREEKTFRYWPRSYQKVENWVWVDRGAESLTGS
ncbi:hypothetical protein BX600DRAFT_450171 [Xylariales sp. PMI_506]|nr:hypothetical protein BX600DRAFT_450171 [Xylariales sp. PMI_506]